MFNGADARFRRIRMGDGGAKPRIGHEFEAGRDIMAKINAAKLDAGASRGRVQRKGHPAASVQPIAHAPDGCLERLAPAMFRGKKTVHRILHFWAESRAGSATLINPVLLSHDDLTKAIQALFLHVSSQVYDFIELVRSKKGRNQGGPAQIIPAAVPGPPADPPRRYWKNSPAGQLQNRYRAPNPGRGCPDCRAGRRRRF